LGAALKAAILIPITGNDLGGSFIVVRGTGEFLTKRF
jgi:hypothetical protein